MVSFSYTCSFDFFSYSKIKWILLLLSVFYSIFYSRWTKAAKILLVPRLREPRLQPGQLSVISWRSMVYEDFSPSDTLQKAKAPNVPRATCSELYDGIAPVSDHTMCAGYFGNVSVFQCYHDRGGGMMCYWNGYFQLDAIMFNFPICGYLELFLNRVCIVLDWIDSTIGW